jgi:hypothetical protein
MSEDKVIDFKSRRPYAVARAEQAKQKRAAKRQQKKLQADGKQEHREAMLEVLRAVINLVEKGELEGLVMVARHPTTKLFFTDVCLDDRIIPTNDLHAYVGCLETLKIELAEGAAMAPAILFDGTTIDPMLEPVDDEEEYFE